MQTIRHFTGLPPSLERPLDGDLSDSWSTSVHPHTTHCCAVHKLAASSMASSHFTRRYWGNHSCFLFLRLLICLNSAGSLVWSEVKIKNFRLVEIEHVIRTSWHCREGQKLVEPSKQYTKVYHTVQIHGSTHINAWMIFPHKLCVDCLTTLRQACSLDIQRAQFAFKDSMIHWILQFTLLIATGYVLHRCTSQEIHR